MLGELRMRAWEDRNAQILCVPDVATDFYAVIPQELRPVVDKLELLLIFCEWAIATCDTKSSTDTAVSCVVTEVFGVASLLEEKGRQTVREGIATVVQSQQTEGRGGIGV